MLFLRGPAGPPHIQAQWRPAESECGVPVLGAVEVTELQVLVYFGGRYCEQCRTGLALRARRAVAA